MAASWPQAPSISRPRVSRTVVGMPLASRRRTNSRSSAGSEAVHFDPGVGLSGIRLTWCAASSGVDRLSDLHEMLTPMGTHFFIDETKAKLESARAAGDAGKVKKLEGDLASREAFLEMARKTAADFNN